VFVGKPDVADVVVFQIWFSILVMWLT